MLKFKTISRTPPNSEYIEPSTGYRVPWVTSFDDVLTKVLEHKRAHGLQLTENWKKEVEEQLASTLKVTDPENWIEDTDNPYIPRLVVLGRQLWKELHEYALSYPERPDDFDKAAALQWYSGWEARIPSAKCECAYKWKRLGRSPELGSRQAFYEWTVESHNVINEMLGKPQFAT